MAYNTVPNGSILYNADWVSIGSHGHGGGTLDGQKLSWSGVWLTNGGVHTHVDAADGGATVGPNVSLTGSPTITYFSAMNHTHKDASQGGQINVSGLPYQATRNNIDVPLSASCSTDDPSLIGSFIIVPGRTGNQPLFLTLCGSLSQNAGTYVTTVTVKYSGLGIDQQIYTALSAAGSNTWTKFFINLPNISGVSTLNFSCQPSYQYNVWLNHNNAAHTNVGYLGGLIIRALWTEW